jgi:hypothetical protein
LGREFVRGDGRTAAFDLPRGSPTGIGDRNARTKKNPNERFGFNPPKEEVEETAEVAELLQPMGLII